MNKYEQNLDKNKANFVPLTPLSFLERAKDIYPNYEALIYEDKKFTWKEIYKRCIKFASALNKTASVVVGSTYPENISYPGHKDFDIIDAGNGRREYAPIRITMDETVDRFNDEAMELSKDQIKEIVDSCKKRLGKPRAYTGTFVPVQQQEQSCSPQQQPQMVIQLLLAVMWTQLSL